MTKPFGVFKTIAGYSYSSAHKELIVGGAKRRQQLILNPNERSGALLRSSRLGLKTRNYDHFLR
jgi:hypothetical protein